MRYIRFICFFVTFSLITAPAFAVLDGTPSTVTPLNFGTIVQNPNSITTVIVSANGSISVTNGTSRGGYTAGEFYVEKSALSIQEQITLSAAAGSLTSGSSSFSISFLNSSTFEPAKYTLGSGGTTSRNSFWGSTISIPANCSAGTYSGMINVTAATNGLYPSRTRALEVYVTIQMPISITKLSDLSFGKIISPAAGSGAGSVTVSQNGQISYSGVETLPGTVSAASFRVDGQPGSAFSVTMPDSVLLTRQGGTETITVQNFTPGSGTIYNLGTGSMTFGNGATLIIPANTKSGHYSGTYSVTVSY